MHPRVEQGRLEPNTHSCRYLLTMWSWRKPIFSNTRKDGAFQAHTVAQSRRLPVAKAASRTAPAASVHSRTHGSGGEVHRRFPARRRSLVRPKGRSTRSDHPQLASQCQQAKATFVSGEVLLGEALFRFGEGQCYAPRVRPEVRDYKQRLLGCAAAESVVPSGSRTTLACNELSYLAERITAELRGRELHPPLL